MTTARNIIEKACRKLHVLGRGQTLSAEESASALETLNDMLSSLSAESVYIYNTTHESFSLTGATSYTIGTSGVFNTAAPIEIGSMFVRQGSIDYALRQLNEAEYANISLKSQTGISDCFYYDANTPLGTIYLYPASPAGTTLNIYSKKALTSFSDLTTDYTLPDGFVDMLVYNLAQRLAPDYEKEAGPTVTRLAAQTLQVIMTSNRRNDYPTMEIEGCGGSAGNVYKGWEN